MSVRDRLENLLSGSWIDGHSAGDVLTLDEELKPNWAPPSGGGGEGGSQPFLVATKTVTHAQILALVTGSSEEIIAAPGAGKTIIPLQGIMHLSPWIADYTNIDPAAEVKLDISGSFLAGNLLEEWHFVSALLAGGGPDGTWSLFPMAGRVHIGAAPDTGHNLGQPIGDGGWYDSDVRNQPMLLTATNGSAGNFTGGDPGNSLTVSVVYQVVTY